MYRNDINQSKLLGIFTILSIVIANIGLFGLVSLLNRKRIREIGIRKVNGAQKWQIVMLLGKQLVIWVAIAVVIAIPVTWYVTRLWLQNFATRISFSWWIVLLGGSDHPAECHAYHCSHDPEGFNQKSSGNLKIRMMRSTIKLFMVLVTLTWPSSDGSRANTGTGTI